MNLMASTLLYGLIAILVIKYVRPGDDNLTVAVIMERAQVDLPFGINRSIGVINMAMDKAQSIVRHSVNLNFLVRYLDVRTCTSRKFGALAAEMYHDNGIHGIIGPGCSDAVTSIARLTAAWKLPHITYAGTFEQLADKAEYSTLTRTAFNLNAFAKFYMEVLKTFSWTDVANIYESSFFLLAMVGRSLQTTFTAAGVKSHTFPFSAVVKDIDREIDDVLSRAKSVARVFLVTSHGDLLRKIALKAMQMGINRGEYSIIYYLSDPISTYIGNYQWQRGDDYDLVAKLAYESVMVVSPRRPNQLEFLDLEKKVKEQALLLYNFSWKPGSQIGIYSIAQYDSFMLYASALNDTINAGEDPKVTTNILRRMWNRTFSGIGGPVFINENGDRQTDFTLLDLDPDTGKFEVVAQYLGYTDTFELLPKEEVSIHWPIGGQPHPNKPPCGFLGELCIVSRFSLTAGVTLGFTLLIFAIVTAGVLYFRNMQREAAILSEWWRVKWEDVKIQKKSMSTGTKGSDGDEPFSMAPVLQDEQTVGVYKGVTVQIWKPKIKFLTIDRKLMLELKQMRDVNCHNLTRLIGLCPDRNNVRIITEYCSRGSLQVSDRRIGYILSKSENSTPELLAIMCKLMHDILHNRSIRLEKEFRLSLINDIVQGMHYLHGSPIGVHGYLSSSTCVIDSRFVLKIAGFGLPSLNDSEADEMSTCGVESLIVPELLWVAPEILRNHPRRSKSQPGDVYSFSIILFEMCTRNEPFITEPWYHTLEETIEELKLEQAVPLRPSFENACHFPEIANLAKECWKEKALERPTFADIKKSLQEMQRGITQGKNVLDMLLNRMEQYANNLEGLVEERTNDFLEEKKRSEELLYQVLPRSVADQLRTGKNVIPEEFRNVTLYFSDIVGFTTISAESTPFQVVDLLNDVYTCFDEIIENFDVYKVETIGDAYMVVSGLPIRNANEHVREIARMSLRILQQVQQFIIRHQPDTPLQARIGVHSGPVVAGVVGRKMPRYCLFGDTVNTASRMESNGCPMKIHISDPTRQLLELFGTFVVETRGYIDIKGKGSMLTHWLLDELHVL